MVIADRIDKLNVVIGRLFSWLTTLLMLVICFDVLMRYVFNSSSAALTETEWHLFAALFMMGAAYTLKYDKHVRVDVFYTNFSDKRKAWVDLIGTLIFLFPFCYVVVTTSIPFVMNAFEVQETSPDPGGLPARYIIKSVIPIGFSLLFLQGISVALNCIKKIIA
ncbi:MAG: TRAP transporter small permease subunit [Cyclobacteriaceae bacterium]